MASKSGFSSPSQTGRRPQFQPPQMRRHVGRRQARVRIDGETIWLAPWGGQYPSPEAQEKFDRILQEWQRRHKGDDAPSGSTRPEPTDSSVEAPPPPEPPVLGAESSGQRISVAELIAACVDHAEPYYRKKDGRQTSS